MGLNSSRFTAVEFGTSKISAVHCVPDQAGKPEVIGFSSRDSHSSIIKGEVIDRDTASSILGEVLAEADRTAGGEFERENIWYLVSGRSVSSIQGEGNVMIYEEDKRITPQHVAAAVKNAMNVPLPPSVIDIDSFPSGFILDMSTKVREPVGHTADRLDAIVHIVLAERNPLDTVRLLLRDNGFEGTMTPVFSGVAAAEGALTRDERESGALLLDFGAGTIEYVAVAGDSVLTTGVIPVGTSNIANDVSIGLDISYDSAEKFLNAGMFEQLKQSGQAFFELPAAPKRRIPFASLEKIIDARLGETFTLVRDELARKDLAASLQSGIVLTGGGALIPEVSDFARSVTGMHVRTGGPLEIGGAMTGLDNPRYSAILGSLKYIIEITNSENAGALNKVADVFENLTGGLMNKFRNATRALTKI